MGALLRLGCLISPHVFRNAGGLAMTFGFVCCIFVGRRRPPVSPSRVSCAAGDSCSNGFSLPPVSCYVCVPSRKRTRTSQIFSNRVVPKIMYERCEHSELSWHESTRCPCSGSFGLGGEGIYALHARAHKGLCRRVLLESLDVGCDL